MRAEAPTMTARASRVPEGRRDSNASLRLQRTDRGPRRVVWLDGVRGAAALFVVLHHVWLASWPAFPRDAGPWWLGWLLYGHLAVAVFIVVSGFSLALAPMRHGGRLEGGARRFIHRRAWRIIPAYWAALVVSTLITGALLRPELDGADLARAFVVHGLLVQDAVGSPVVNGTFWSIAVEWQIYFLFPLVLWIGRKWSLEAAVALAGVVVIVVHLVATIGGPLGKLDHLSPQFLALFAAGVLAAKLGLNRRSDLRRPIGALACLALLSVPLVAVFRGSVWTVERYFYVDLVFGLGVACVLFLMLAGGWARLRGLLARRSSLRLGLFSYSIYLIHGPILAVLDRYVTAPLGLPPLAEFALLLVVGLPLVLVLAYAFHRLFEAPFLHRRDMGALRTLPVVLLLRRRPRHVVVKPSVAAEHEPG